MYLQPLRQLLSPGPKGKRLLTGAQPKLRARLQNVPPDMGSVKVIPALCSLAWAVHTLIADQPWLQHTQPERFHPTIKEVGHATIDSLPWEDDSQADDDDEDGGAYA